ncbi:MAG: cyclic 2,3-diphosphoglycerate synthetase [Planctomycetota bacterium]
MTVHATWLSPMIREFLAGPLHQKRLICLVDGEHYPPVVENTVKTLESEGGNVAALVFIGGTEKIENASEELAEAAPNAEIFTGAETREEALKQLPKAIRKSSGEAVVDLSDEPVVDYAARFRLMSHTLAERIPYVGADFYFRPAPEVSVLSKPSVAIIGTGKRVGKTAVGVSVSRLLARQGMDPVVVCMGRGGPPEPQYVNAHEMDLNADTLLSVAEGGGHAASDYWEDALLSQVPTVGCRRCGGGMAGTPVASNVMEGARIADESSHNFVIMEGSGATFAPVKTDRRVVLIGAAQPLENVLEYLGEYRLSISDLAIVTMCEEPMASPEKVQRLEEEICDIKPDIDIALTVFRPEPLGDIYGKGVFLATTAPEECIGTIVDSLETEHDCEITGVSTNLSNRPKLREDLAEGLGRSDVLLTEIKAASIDVAGLQAKKQGVDIVFLHNKLEMVGGNISDLDDSILKLCQAAKGAN